MKLSEAIREGAKLKPQGFGYVNAVRNFQDRVSCAYEAAIEATLETSDYYADGNLEKMLEQYGRVLTSKSHCPVCSALSNKTSARTIICHLNDFHRWTRERIAGWVEIIEAQV